jgi:hypothetical protein
MHQNKTHLLVGGLVAMGFDPTGKFLLTVSHAGRGVFSTDTWQRVARDPTVLYPRNGSIQGIGPLAGVEVSLAERNEQREQVTLQSPDGKYELLGESDGITLWALGA